MIYQSRITISSGASPSATTKSCLNFSFWKARKPGLSWDTILRKRENYRAAFDDFDAEKIARYDEKKIEELMRNAGIVRNRLKIVSTVQNAREFLKIQGEFESFSNYVWRFVGGEPIKNSWESLSEVPARTAISDAMSKDLKRRGFNFVGSTIMYAFMQACGLVNDHLIDCFRRDEV